MKNTLEVRPSFIYTLNGKDNRGGESPVNQVIRCVITLGTVRDIHKREFLTLRCQVEQVMFTPAQTCPFIDSIKFRRGKQTE